MADGLDWGNIGSSVSGGMSSLPKTTSLTDWSSIGNSITPMSFGTSTNSLGLFDSIGKGISNVGGYIGSGLESIGNYADKYGKGIDVLTGLGGLYLQKQNYDDQRDYQNRLMALAEGKQDRAETMEDQAISNMQTGFAGSGLSRKKPTSLSSVTV